MFYYSHRQLLIVVIVYFTVVHGAILCSTFLQLQQFKTSNGELSKTFLGLMKYSFNKNIFFETGTYGGGTTQNAALVFGEVYSSEISDKIYHAAIQKLRSQSNVHLYIGDSPIILSRILPALSQDIFFWLDAHYCGVGTGKGSSDSPIIQELVAIRNCSKNKSVIMIDDLRGFYSENWPLLSDVLRNLLSINPNFVVIAFGDSLLSFLRSDSIVVSECLKAMTVSRFFDTRCFHYSVAEVLEAEEVIAKTNGTELNALHYFFSYINGSADQYGKLWQALIYEQNKNFRQASVLLQDILATFHSRGINHWRLNWYLARNAFKMNDLETAKSELTKLINKHQDFEPAKKLLNIINNGRV